MFIYLSLLVAIIGLVLYICTDAKLSEIGRILFFAGMLAFLLGFPSAPPLHVIR